MSLAKLAEVPLNKKKVGRSQMVDQIATQSVVYHILAVAIVLKLTHHRIENPVVHCFTVSYRVFLSQSRTVLQPRMLPNFINAYSFGWILHKNFSM